MRALTDTPGRLSAPTRNRYSRSVYLEYPAAVAALAVGAQALLAGLLDLTKGADSALVLGASGVVFFVAGAVALQRLPLPAAGTASGVFSLFVWGWLVAAGLGAVVFWLSGAVSRPDHALFEAVAGLSTTNVSGLVPEDQDRGILAFRALNQWFGAGAAVVLAVVFIPAVARAPAITSRTRSRRAIVAPDLFTGLRNLSALYGAFTAVLVLAFFAVGMGPFDSLTYAMTTASTGGFANHNDSLGYFDSAAVEWVGTAGMLFAGLSILVVWAVVRGDVGIVRRSRELQLYLVAFVVATVSLAVWRSDEVGGWRSIREAAFTVASAMSTTGHLVGDLGVWPEGAEVALLGLISVGTMAGAIGGGFRWLRLIEAWGYGQRELRQQTTPRAVYVVKVGSSAVSEAALGRMHAYFLMFVSLVFAGAFVVGLFDDWLTVGQSIAASLSSVSTYGPVPAGEGVSLDPGQLHDGSRWALAVAMLLGRLSIYPVLLAVSGVSVRAARAVRR